MPIFAPALVYSGAEVRGWFLYSWLARKGVSEGSQAAVQCARSHGRGQLEAAGSARRYHGDRALGAFTAAEHTAHDAKPLLAFAEG
jgi:hypothetical protein